MKTVFNNTMTAHVWAQLKQPHGRNSTSSMLFDGAVAYSYREPVAHIVETGTDANAMRVALFTSRKWSVTTSGHVNDYRRAVSGITCFHVPDLLLGRFVMDERTDHSANLKYFADQYAESVAALMRAPADSYRLANWEQATSEFKDRPHATLYDENEARQNYARAFGIKADALPWSADADKIIARRDRLLSDPKRAAKREAGRKAREAKEERRIEAQQAFYAELAKENAEKLEAWKAGANVPIYYTQDGLFAILRVRGDNVETSQGAVVPVAHARRAIRLIRGVASGEFAMNYPDHWERDRTTESDDSAVGDFIINRIEANGNIQAGCHRIQFAEIDRIGRELGV